jgi:Tol biopolymer transport system component
LKATDSASLLSAQETGRSLVEPRPSPDGRFLVFTACDYGHFPIYQTNSALYLMDLATKAYHRMELNSGR